MAADLEALQAALGYVFRDPELLVRALTHTSWAHERCRPGETIESNERLEFLGDAILGFVVSEFLFQRFPTDGEGRLSKLKAHLVSEFRLFEVAEALGIGDYLLLGRGEDRSGGRTKKALLADAVEAVIAAIYLDGGMDDARHLILEQIVAETGVDDRTAELAVADFKGALQQRVQNMNLPAPRYLTVGEDGPEHAKTFTVEVRVGDSLAGRAQGFTKKSAGQKAAQILLERLAGLHL